MSRGVGQRSCSGQCHAVQTRHGIISIGRYVHFPFSAFWPDGARCRTESARRYVSRRSVCAYSVFGALVGRCCADRSQHHFESVGVCVFRFRSLDRECGVPLRSRGRVTRRGPCAPPDDLRCFSACLFRGAEDGAAGSVGQRSGERKRSRPRSGESCGGGGRVATVVITL